MAESNRDTPLCPCGFWGSVQTAGLCSKCYKEMLRKQECSGCPLQTPNPCTSDNAKSQLNQKLSDNFDLIFSSNHNNKPQESANNDEGATIPSNDVEDNADSIYLQAEESVVLDPSMVTVATTAVTPAVTSAAAAATAELAAVESTTTALTSIPTIISTSASVVPPTSTTPRNPSTSTTPPITSISLITPGAHPSYILTPSSSSTPTLAMFTPAINKLDKADSSTIGTSVTDMTLTTVGTDSVVDRPVQKNRKRCFKCNCKLDLASSTIGLCKCDYVFCDLHRLPEQHDCTFDHKTHGRQDARKKMVSPKKHMGTTLRRLDS